MKLEEFSSPDFQQALKRNIRTLTRGKTVSEQPQTILLGGQSGAGKTTIHRIKPEDLRYIRIENSNGDLQISISDIKLPTDTDEAYKYIKGAIQAYPELYFAKLVVLGEGDSEELLLPKFFDLLGKEIDSSQISIVPLGGRHVNYFWKLLNSLKIPYITLLDFDNERYGGGWGRIKYISQYLCELSMEFQEWFNSQGLDLNEIETREPESINAPRLNNWFNKLEEFNVYFSSPLDIDFLMLQSYKDYPWC